MGYIHDVTVCFTYRLSVKITGKSRQGSVDNVSSDFITMVDWFHGSGINLVRELDPTPWGTLGNLT